MKVLVTGSTGFIGSHLCRTLLERGHTVVAFHRPSSPLRQLEGLDVEHAIGDLTQPETLNAPLQGVEVVFHAAALAAVRARQVGRLYAVNVEGTRFLLKAAQAAGVGRVVVTGDAASLGLPERVHAGDVPGMINENHTWNCRPQIWHYAYTRYLAEREVQRVVAQGLDVVTVNPSLVLGAGDVYRQTSSWIMLTALRQIKLLAEGGLNAIHVDDVIDGHLAALEHGVRGERYLLVGENLTYLQLVQKIAEQVGVTIALPVLPAWLAQHVGGAAHWFPGQILPTAVIQMLRLAGYYFYYDAHKAQTILGLSAPRPLEDAIRETCDWFISTGALATRDDGITPRTVR